MSIELPVLHGMAPGTRKGRSVYEGYQRGWGLQFGGLADKVRADPLYREALKCCRDRTIMSESNRMNLFLLMTCFVGRLPPGHVVEYGSYRGGSALFLAFLAKRLHPGMTVFALDSFEGMPETDKTVDAHNKGDFADADLPGLVRRIAETGLDNLVPVKGRFEDTNAGVMARAGRVALAHVDCDIAPAVRFAYEGVMPHMVPGGYVVFDDATVSSCIGATEVVEEVVIRRDGLSSEQIWPHFVFRAPGRA